MGRHRVISVKTIFLLLFLGALSAIGIGGPPTLEINTRTSAFSGHYRYEPRGEPSRRGTVELRIEFAPLPQGTAPTATFGDASFRITAVSLVIDGLSQKFPPELLASLGFCTPEAIFFYDDESKGLLMLLDFSAGKERTGFSFRIRNETVSKEPSK